MHWMYSHSLDKTETIKEVFKEAYRVVKKDGWIFISLSNFREIVTSLSEVILPMHKETKIILDLNLDFKKRIAIVYGGTPIFLFLQK